MGKQIVLQPAGHATATIHYQDTISTPVSLSRLRPHLDAIDYGHLMQIYPDGAAPVWGVTPGKTDQNHRDWERMNIADIVLFAKQGTIFSSGEVAFKIHSRPIAEELWKVNTDGETWEYVFFVKAMKERDITYAKFNTAAGYKQNNVIQGFRVLPEEQSASIIDALNLNANDDPTQQLIVELASTAEKEGAFDANSEEDARRRELAFIVRRQGQPEFRKRLLELYEGKCAISGCNALQALEAAHITPYNGDRTNHPCNGILLRSDLHTLFDLGLLTVDSTSMEVRLAPTLEGSTYSSLAKKKIQLPKQDGLRPSVDALSKHNSFAQAKTKISSPK